MNSRFRRVSTTTMAATVDARVDGHNAPIQRAVGSVTGQELRAHAVHGRILGFDQGGWHRFGWGLLDKGVDLLQRSDGTLILRSSSSVIGCRSILLATRTIIIIIIDSRNFVRQVV